MLRRIAEALEAKRADGPTESDDAGEHMVHDDVTTKPEPAHAHGEVDDAGEPTTTTDVADIKLTKLTIPELQERYRQVIGRDTRSTPAAYLQWKIRQAEKGRVRIGPVQRRTAEGEFKVLPVRMEAVTVTALGEARVRLGLESRMALIRLALHADLDQAGELEVAALLSDCPGADG